MGKQEKFLEKVLCGRSNQNIDFKQLCNLLYALNFNKKIIGDHHIFTKDGIEEIINIQPAGSKAKAYQVRQIRDIIVKYSLDLEE